MMDYRTFLAAPKASLGVVDVRDVARAHVGKFFNAFRSRVWNLDALSNPKTNGQRILITSQPSVWFSDWRKWLQEEFADKGAYFTNFRGCFLSKWVSFLFWHKSDWLAYFIKSLINEWILLIVAVALTPQTAKTFHKFWQFQEWIICETKSVFSSSVCARVFLPIIENWKLETYHCAILPLSSDLQGTT